MHEMSLIHSMFDSLKDQFDEELLNDMTAIDLEVGQLSNVEPTLMRNAFAAYIAVEERYKDVKLNITYVPVEIYCEACDTHTSIVDYKFVCGTCGAPNNNVVKGMELLIRRVHFDVDEQ